MRLLSVRPTFKTRGVFLSVWYLIPLLSALLFVLVPKVGRALRQLWQAFHSIGDLHKGLRGISLDHPR